MTTYNTMTTRAAGYVVPASEWNKIKYNFDALRPDTCGVGRTAVQSIPDSVLTAMLWDAEAAENWDHTNMHSLVGDTDRINILRTGVYLITANVRFLADATGTRECYVYRSDAAALWGETKPGSASYDAYFSPNFTTHLNVGDYVSVKVLQSAGHALDILRDGVRIPNFAVTLLYDET